MTLHARVVAADELPGELEAVWRAIQHRSPELRHPMLAAAFVQTVARSRDDVRVAVITRDEEITGLFPFQTSGDGAGHPVGYRLNDWQGGVFAADAPIEAGWLLKSCGLRVWQFDHLITQQRCFAPGHFVLEDSPHIDLSRGLDAYVADIAERARWKSHARNAQRLARDAGAVRFEFHTADAAAFNSLLQWKTRQIRQHGRRCVFDWPWVRQSLEELRTTEDDGCTGTLSALYAGDTLAAVHLGLRSRDVLHWWITTYNPDLARYSPGALLLVRVIEEAASRGVQRIELGKGSEFYKSKFQSGAVPLASGAVARPRWRHVVQRSAWTMKARIQASPLSLPARRLAYWMEARANRADDGGATTSQANEADGRPSA